MLKNFKTDIANCSAVHVDKLCNVIITRIAVVVIQSINSLMSQ